MTAVAARSVKSRSFTLYQVPLTPVERTVFDLCQEAAEAGKPAPSIEDLSVAIGATGVATIPGIMKRLESKGYITRQIFQRGRIVCIAQTGQCTLPPNDQTPHWRTRTERVPAPAIQSVRERVKPVAAMIEAEARLLGKSPADFLSDLVYIGWHEYQAEKENRSVTREVSRENSQDALDKDPRAVRPDQPKRKKLGLPRKVDR